MKNKIAFISALRCHMFDVGHLLEAEHKVKVELFTAYPRWKLKNELFPVERVKTFPWWMVPKLALQRWKLITPALDQAMNWQTIESLDCYVARHVDEIDVLEGISSFTLRAGKRVQSHGGKFIVHHGLAHPRVQQMLLAEEAKRWKAPFLACDPRIVAKELEEFAMADKINVPSFYARRTFLEEGIEPAKIAMIPYGVDLDYFQPVESPEKEQFQIIFSGQISVRKGIPYLLEAFAQFKHPNKRLILVGEIWSDIKPLLDQFNLTNVEFVGRVNRIQLKKFYSESHCMVLPSIDDGFGKVITEAMACGCPVIATENTGAYGYLENGVDGYIVPIRDSQAITERLQQWADDRTLRENMAQAALQKVQQAGGWGEYAQEFYSLCQQLMGMIPASKGVTGVK